METNFESAVGKTYRVNGVEGSTAEHRYKVAELLPKFDFGPRRGGIKAAFRIVRQDHDTESIVSATAFLAGHEEAPAEAQGRAGVTVVALLVAFALLLGLGLSARAATYTMFGNLATVNGTSNGPSVLVATLNLPAGNYIIQNNGLASTNALLINCQFSTDNTNFVTFSTWNPGVTNSGSATFYPSPIPQNIYFRLQVVTTNAVQVGTLLQL